jgi:hypothetical protein
MITTKNIKNKAVAELIDFKRNAFPVEKKQKWGESLLPQIPFFGIWGDAGEDPLR